MKESLPHKKPPSGWYSLFRRPLPLELETGLFLLVSVLDFLMTYRLLVESGSEGLYGKVIFYESTPIARFFLNHWGPKGLFYFKLALFTFVAVIAQIIACKKIETARKLLNFATILIAGVVIYSLSLLLRTTGIL